METLNVIYHMNEFRNIISYASNIGFFFGAGTSCAFGLPTIIQLSERVKTSLVPDQQTLFCKMEEMAKDLFGKARITVEDILNNLREIRELTNERSDYSFNSITGEQAKTLDKCICDSIFEIIKTETEKTDIKELRRFFAWYEAANRGCIKEIYTTNYDMLLEMAMESNFIPFLDGFSGSYEPFFTPESIESFPGDNDSTNRWIRLWKLHGSLNWIKRDATSYSDERIIRVGRIDEPKNEIMIYPSREKYKLSRKEPFVAYFDRLKNYLTRGEVVLIISGYSFNDEHINEIIYNSLRNNNRLYITVFCFDDNQVEDMSTYISSFTNLCVAGPTKVIVNGVMKEWIYDDRDNHDIGSNMYWDDVNKKFLLGNFKSLIDFLIENSGRKNIIEEIVDAK